jgi:predicted nucleotidyltransferase
MRHRSELSASELDVDALVEILDGEPVTCGILFGSYATGDQRSGSDIDLAVEFDSSLSSLERTRARLRIIEEVSVALGLDAVDVVPLSGAPESLHRDIHENGVLLYGSADDADTPADDETEPDHEETLARFDRVIADLEHTV